MPVNIIPSADYYENQDLHGSYQYITLEDIVNNYMMSTDDDDFASNVPRHKVLFQARRAFRELYFDSIQEVKVMSLELSDQLTVTLPPDFVNYVRISWLGDDNLLRPMASNGYTNIARDYLQGDSYEILFDDDGCALQDDVQGLAELAAGGEGGTANSYTFCGDAFNPNKNMANVYSNGSYVVDKNNGLIKFGSEVFGKTVVLEYISDGLYTGCEGSAEVDLKIHKFAEDSVYNWMYWKLIERRKNVPANAKVLARKDWFNSRRICKRRMNTIRPAELRQVFKGSSRWFKA